MRQDHQRSHQSFPFASRLASGLMLVLAVCGCTTYNQNGELVRHHFGYVRVVTPQGVATGRQLQALEVETLGLWLDVDRREASGRTGSGAGVGYRHDRRELIPEGCRVVFRVADAAALRTAWELIRSSSEQGEGICAVRD